MGNNASSTNGSTSNAYLTNSGTIFNAALGYALQGTLVSLDTNGFTINWTVGGGGSYTGHYLALGGTDLSVFSAAFTPKTSTGTQAYTGTGFQPKLLLFALLGSTTTNGNNGVGYGAAASTTARWAFSQSATGGATMSSTALASRIQDTTKCINLLTASGATTTMMAADLTSMDANGFTLNWTTASATAVSARYLALGGAAASFAVGAITKAANTTATSETVTCGFQPSAYMLFTNSATSSTAQSTGWRSAIGASDGTNWNQGCWENKNGVLSTQSRHSITGGGAADLLLQRNLPASVSAAGTTEVLLDHGSMTATGFTVNYATNATTTQYIFPWIAFPFIRPTPPAPTDPYGTMIAAESSLRHYWRLDESSGRVYDYKGTDDLMATSSGSLVQGAATSSLLGNIGATWTTQQTTDRISGTSVDVGTGGTNPFTMECWFKWSSTQTVAYGQFFDTTNGSAGYYFGPGNSTQLDCLFYGTGGSVWVGGVNYTVTKDVWHHVALTYDGANAAIYIDSILQGSSPVTGGSFAGPGSSGGANLVLGNSYPTSPTTNYSIGGGGGVDEVAWYNTALTKSQITNHFLIGSGQVAMGATIPISDYFNAPALNTTLWGFWGTGAAIENDSGYSGYPWAFPYTLAVNNAGPGASTYGGVLSKSSYDLTNKSMFVYLQLSSTWKAGQTATIQLQIDSNNYLEIGMVDLNVVARTNVAGTLTTLGTVANTSLHNLWLRITESAGKVYFSYYDTGYTIFQAWGPLNAQWTPLGTAVADPFAVTALLVNIVEGCYQAVTSPGKALYSSLNTWLPITWTGSSGIAKAQASTSSAIANNEYSTTILSNFGGSLKYYWRFDEAAGTTCWDSALNANLALQGALQPRGTSALSDGIGKSATLDGSVNYIYSSDYSTPWTTTGFTIETWLRATSWTVGAPIFQRRYYDNTNKGGFSLEVAATNGTLNWFIDTSGNGTWQNITTWRPLSTGQWHHIVASWSPSGGGTLTVMVNGAIEAQAGSKGTFYNFADAYGNTYVGKNSYTNALLAGNVDEMAIYTNVMTLAVAQDHYYKGIKARDSLGSSIEATTGLQGYWRMHEAGDANAFDESGHGLTMRANPTGVNVMQPGLSTDVPSYAYSLDGTTNATLDSAAPFSLLDLISNPFTWEMWIYPTTANTEPIIDYSNGTATQGFHVWQYDTPTALYANYVDSSGGNHAIQSTTGVIKQNQWNHIVVVRDVNTGIAYVNGAQVGTIDLSGYALLTNITNNFGWRNGGGGGNFTGKLAQFAYYNVALSPTQVALHYAAGGGSMMGAFVAQAISTATLRISLGAQVIATQAVSSGSVTFTQALPAVVTATQAVSSATLSQAFALAGATVSQGAPVLTTLTAGLAGTSVAQATVIGPMWEMLTASPVAQAVSTASPRFALGTQVVATQAVTSANLRVPTRLGIALRDTAVLGTPMTLLGRIVLGAPREVAPAFGGNSIGQATLSGTLTAKQALAGTIATQAGLDEILAAPTLLVQGSVIAQAIVSGPLTEWLSTPGIVTQAVATGAPRILLAGPTVTQASTSAVMVQVQALQASFFGQAALDEIGAAPTLKLQGLTATQALSTSAPTVFLPAATVTQVTLAGALSQVNILTGTVTTQAALDEIGATPGLKLSLGNQTIVAQAVFVGAMSNLTGIGTAQASTSAIITVAFPPQVTTAQASSTSAQLIIGMLVTGATVTQAQSTATLTAKLQGATVTQVLSTNTLVLGLAGNAATQAVSTAALSQANALAGTIATQAALDEVGPIPGLKVALGSQAVVAQAISTGAFGTGVQMAGAVLTTTNTTAALKLVLAPVAIVTQAALDEVLGAPTVLLASQSVALSTGTGTLTIGLAGTVTAQALVFGPATELLTGQITTQATLSAIYSPLIGSAVVVAQATATAQVALALQGSVVAQAQATGQLPATYGLAGLTVAQASTSCSLVPASPLVGASAAQATVFVPNPFITYFMAGSVLPQASTSVTALTVRVALSGQVVSQAISACAFGATLVPLPIRAQSQFDALLNTLVAGSVQGQALVQNVPFVLLLAGQSVAQAASSAQTGQRAVLSGTVIAQASLSAPPVNFGLSVVTIAQAQTSGVTFVQAGTEFAGIVTTHVTLDAVLAIGLGASGAAQGGTQAGLTVFVQATVLTASGSTAAITRYQYIQPPPLVAQASSSLSPLRIGLTVVTVAQSSFAAGLLVYLPPSGVLTSVALECEIAIFKMLFGSSVGQATLDATLHINRFEGTTGDGQIIHTGPSRTSVGGSNGRTSAGGRRRATSGSPYGSRTSAGASGKVTWGNPNRGEEPS